MNGGRLIYWLSVTVLLLGATVVLVPERSRAQSLPELLRRQEQLRREAEESRKRLEQKKREANDLSGVISSIDGDISYTESQIANTESQIETTSEVINELHSQIEDSQGALDALNERLRVSYVTLYELSQTSTVEILLQADSLNEVVSQAQYLESIQDDLQKKISEANAIKADLEAKRQVAEDQKSELERLRDSLANSKLSLSRQRNQKSYLLQLTRGEQAEYEALLKKLEAQQEVLSQEIYEARRRSGGGESIYGGSGGYPWADEPNPYAVDPWLFYKRQCTSYAAWKFLAVHGQVFYNTRPGQGNAWNWPALARDQGYQTSSTPRANAVVSWGIGPNRPYGHVAWVTAVNPNGTINVTEYNWVIERGFSERHNVDPYRYGTATYIYP